MKYELIQTYPGYETLGTIHCSENKTPEWRGTIFYDSYPTYWKKVEEVDYEIISYVTDISNPQSKLQIYSVKRKSDDEVFTVGDKYSYNSFSKDIIEEIKRFEIKGNNCRVYSDDSFAFCSLIGIKKLQPKTPLFTTEDGAAIFKGDKFSVVQLSTFHQINNCSYPLIDAINWKCFSTKEKAEEYILLNKPCLSIIDIVYDEKVPFAFVNNELMEFFKALAKSKL